MICPKAFAKAKVNLTQAANVGGSLAISELMTALFAVSVLCRKFGTVNSSQGSMK